MCVITRQRGRDAERERERGREGERWREKQTEKLEDRQAGGDVLYLLSVVIMSRFHISENSINDHNFNYK